MSWIHSARPSKRFGIWSVTHGVSCNTSSSIAGASSSMANRLKISAELVRIGTSVGGVGG